MYSPQLICCFACVYVLVDNLLYSLLAVEVSAFVEHESSPTEAGGIFYGNCGQRPLSDAFVGDSGKHVAGHQLFYGL
jgi:hypothetical protein